MKYILILISFALLGLFACTGGEDKVKIPSNILPPDSMVGIFVDFQLAESAIQMKQMQRKDPTMYTGFYYSMILKKHKINRPALDKNLKFYSRHPKLLREIYDKVVSELSTKQSRALQ